MNSPPPMAEFLDMIKERYEGCKLPLLYKIVKVPARYDGTTFVVCETEIVYNYDDLCVKMFDLDVSGWEISEGIAYEPMFSSIENESIFMVVTIHMVRSI